MQKSQPPRLFDGAFRTWTGDPTDFVRLLQALEPTEALGLGVEKQGRLKGRIVTEKVLKSGTTADAVARTKGHFEWPAGPGVLALDLDLKDAVPHLPQLPNPLTIDSLREVLIAAAPGLADVPMVGWPSASACIYRTDTDEELRGLTGARFHVFVANAADIPALGRTIHERLMLAGYRFAFVSRSGMVLPRSIIDASVWSPERLDFAAGASCRTPLTQKRGDPHAWCLERDIYLSPSLLPPLSESESEKLKAIEKSLRALVRPEAEQARAQHIERQRSKGRTISAEWNDEGTVAFLNGDHELVLDGAGTVTIDEVLGQPDKYHGQRCADPMESDYQDDPRIAQIFTRNQTTGAVINSFAHGGTVYLLRPSVEDLFTADESTPASPATPRDHHLTDMGNAGRYAALHAEKLMFAGGLWREWDERRWCVCDDVTTQERAKEVVRAMYTEASQIVDGEKRKALWKWAEKSESLQRLIATVTLARGEMLVAETRLDADPWLMTVLNGTVDLRTGELRPHSRTDYITRLAPVVYDSAATCPTWLAFLDRIMGGDQELVDALQRMVGYSLTGVTSEQVFFLLYGTGANGKTTFLEILREFFGDHAVQTKHTTLLERRDNSGPRPDIVRLRGKRLITASEVPPGGKFDAATVKALTGGDTLTDRNLYAGPIEFKIDGKAWLAANHRPLVDGGDPAMWRRLALVPFNVAIPEDERDPDLRAKLHAELPGIFAWAVQGCLLWRLVGLSLPRAITDATDSYRAETSTVAAFIRERCEVVRGNHVAKAHLYRAYVEWCQSRNELDLTEREFNDAVKRHDPGRIESRKISVMCWAGLSLREPQTGADTIDGVAA